MSTRTRNEPDLDAEREVDLGRYLDALVARWWLPLLGIVAGVAIGYLLALGGKDVYRAEATVYVGTPYGPNGANALQGLSTNPSTVARIARGQETIQKVSAESGMSPRELRAGISTRAIRSGLARTVSSQLYVVSVQGSRRLEVSAATNAIAERIEDEVGGYARLKRKTFQEQLASDNRQLAAIDRFIEETQNAGRAASGVERLTIATSLLTAELRRGTLEQDRLQARQLLALAEQVELPRILDRGSAAKTTARSTRNSAAVAGLIGLILGLLAALLWDPIVARTGRR
jgi:Chain length determinant protein